MKYYDVYLAMTFSNIVAESPNHAAQIITDQVQDSIAKADVVKFYHKLDFESEQDSTAPEPNPTTYKNKPQH